MIGGRPVYLLPLFHPAAGLRTPAVADQLREDFEAIPELPRAGLPEGPAGRWFPISEPQAEGSSASLAE